MILGNGLIASAFKRFHSDIPQDTVVIARGVSNSLEICDEAYEREWQFLQEAVSTASPTTRFVYFSSSKLDSSLRPDDRRYFHEKLSMEQMLLSEVGPRVLIVRLPQLVGSGGHPNNAFNYLWRSVCADVSLKVFSDGERRELLDVSEVAPVVCKHLKAQRHGILRLQGVSFEVTEIVRAMRHQFDSLRGLDAPQETGIDPYLNKLLKHYALLSKAPH